jgi:hypothetical protein
MLSDILSWTSVGLILVTSVALLVSQSWQRSLLFLSLQYLGMFWLVSLHWPMTMAAVKLVTGWIAAAALGMSQPQSDQPTSSEEAWPQGRIFRLLAAGLVILAVTASAPAVIEWLPSLHMIETLGSFILIGMGLLHLSVTARPFRTILGLLTVLAGFETLYAAVENSIMVAAMLSVINLGLALVGAYLLSTPPKEEAAE